MNDYNPEQERAELAAKKKKVLTKLILRSATFVAGVAFLLATGTWDEEGYLVIDAGGNFALIAFGIVALPYVVLIWRILFYGAGEVLNDFSFSYTETTYSDGSKSSDYSANFLGMMLGKLFYIVFRAFLAAAVVFIFALFTPIQVIYYLVMLRKLKRTSAALEGA